MKKVAILITLIVLMFGIGITYSVFHSHANLSSNNQNIAKFIFESQDLSNINLSLTGINPGDIKEYLFAVTNAKDDVISEVTIEYQIIIKTYHFIPLTIKLYAVTEDEDIFIFECDETASRNKYNELICNSSVYELTHKTDEGLIDNYKLVLEFPKEHNDPVYSDLVDFLNLEIKSWQKI